MKAKRSKFERAKEIGDTGVAEEALRRSVAMLKLCESGANLDDVLDHDRTSSHSAIVADILFNYFRNKALIDFAIAKFADSGKRRPVKADIRRILAVSLTQSFFQSGIPPAVAVNVAVGHAKKLRGARVAGFVNAVARRALEAGPKKLAHSAPLHVRLNIPELLLKKWGEKSEIASACAEIAGHRPECAFRVVDRGISDEELERAGCRKLDLPEWMTGGLSFHSTETPDT